MVSSQMIPLFAFLALQLTISHAVPQYSNALDPCYPSPCGPNTQCSTNSNGAAICRCLPGNFPKPDTITGCGPQCTSDYDCRSHEKCYGSKCESACAGNPCGVNAECESSYHKAICKCYRGYQGDPFTQCYQSAPIARRIISAPAPQAIAVRVSNPCAGNPCGVNAECRSSGDRPVCTCLPGHQGNPLSICRRGECSSNAECPSFKVCENFQCVNPCARACGSNANCDVRNRIPVCTCPSGYTGDPLNFCRRYDENELCNPSPCGSNTKCRVENGRAICSCLPSYIGSPLTGCRHECERDTECGPSESCVQFKCKNPCLNACGQYASCDVRNHVAVCRCPSDYLGDPYTRCFPECTSHSECPGNLACIGLKCADPCKGACGRGAECKVDRSNHKAICSCPRGFTGHPFDECRPFTPADLCSPNPCGANAICTPGSDNRGNERPVCTCPSGFIGDALRQCNRGECQTDSDCGSQRNCNNFQCVNPCSNACGVNANCEVRNHGAICSCPRGFSGDPFSQCNAEPSRGKRQSASTNSTIPTSTTASP